MMETSFIVENNAFMRFGYSHLGTLALLFLLGFLMIFVARRFLTKGQQIMLANMVAGFMCLVVIIWTIIKAQLGIFTIDKHLPFDLCNFMGVTAIILTLTRSYRMYEVYYFWILAGTLQALITPDLPNDFPHYTFWKYWVVHGGLVIVILYMTFVFDMRPTLKSIWRSFLWLQVFFVSLLLVNYLTGSNYGYLNAKPETASLLDYMPEWPYYLLTGQMIVLPLMFLVYSPWLIKDWRDKKRKIATIQ